MNPLNMLLDFFGNKLDHYSPNELEMFFKNLAELLPAPARQEAARAAYYYHQGVRAQNKTLELVGQLLQQPDPSKHDKPTHN